MNTTSDFYNLKPKLNLEVSDFIQAYFGDPTHLKHLNSLTKPKWDDENRILYWGTIVARAYSKQAWACHQVLRAFERSDWPKKLSLKDLGLLGAEKVADAVKSLKSARRNPLRYITFREVDGGKAIMWLPVADGEYFFRVP